MVLPCPICGKGMNMLTKARTFPEHGTARRRDFCIALGVPHNTFDHIRTRRKMCFSHFDEEEFYIGRHILKHCAMPRELTEREKFILFNSDFNKARFRRRKQPRNDTEEDTPSSSKSNCYGTFETSNKDGVTKVRFKKKKIQKVPAPRVSRQTVPVSNTNVSNAPSVTILNGDGIRIAEGPTPTDPTQPKLYFIILPPPPVNNQATLSHTNNGGGVSKMSNKVRKTQSSSNSSDMIKQKVIKQEIMEPSTDSAEFNVTALSSLRGNEIPSSSHANNEYGILQNSSGFKEGQISSGFISQRVIKQEIMEPSTDECNFKAPPRVQGLPSYPHNSAEMLNNDQEVGITSNTDLILSRCLQLSKS